MHKQQLSQKKAFTLIEMLVVIFVLWVGILSIVVLITRNLSLTQNIHIQNSATILAREGIELAYNYKNTNTMLWYPWNCAIRTTTTTSEDNCEQYFYTWNSNNSRFRVDGILQNQSQVILTPVSTAAQDFDTIWNETQLYLTGINVGNSTITWYTHEGGSPSPFARFISFTGMSNLPQGSPIISQDIHHITSTVLFHINNTTTGQVSLESFISNPR